MAHKQKGLVTTSGEWAKHLRGFFKRKFWKRERKVSKALARKKIQEKP